ncbi:4-hydroxy-3-methylbut-2-enyl diphosphate reductase [Mycoplasma sp. P36-A1]|uniref:4-hydroxy-3-methylbut-2-enyl diphosphate reductase n=1 Tax=Mycoplasma sp. P36-A1 TaxID=3252900 RepID=UPI003C303942
MKVDVISPRGYCFGVINAIDTALKAKAENPQEKINILGMIVHNQYIVDALKNKGINTIYEKNKSRLELLQMIEDGVVVLTAHGSAPEVKKAAIDKGLIVYDATCKDVKKTHDLVLNYLNEGYDIIYFGKKNHPESDAIKGVANNNIHIISNIEDALALKINNDKILLTNQTTISYLDAEKVFEQIKDKYPNVVVAEEICNATRVRQQAISKIADDVDAVYIVGDPSSNNSTRLKMLAENDNRKAFLIESVTEIRIEDLVGFNKVAVSSGASTPTYLTQQVIKYLQSFNKDNKDTYQKPEIDYNKII